MNLVLFLIIILYVIYYKRFIIINLFYRASRPGLLIFDETQVIMAEERKTHDVPDLDRETIKRIATKARDMRINKGYSYEAFALQAGINRNTYHKFEKSAATGENFTMATLLKVVRGLEQSLASFFEDL
jgi:DNA-binding XRE family transcriptional regulator